MSCSRRKWLRKISAQPKRRRRRHGKRDCASPQSKTHQEQCILKSSLTSGYVLFFIQLESRRVCLAGITPYPDQQWMEQIGRNVTMQKWGFLANSRYLLHDRDSKFCMSFRQLIEAGRVKTMPYGQKN